MQERLDVPGAAHRELDGNVTHLNPEHAVFEAMLAGWAGQQSARLLSMITIGQREGVLRRFAHFTGSWPWQWSPGDVEDWAGALRSGPSPCSHSTLRYYQNSVALFLSYLIDRRYGWSDECLQRFGTHPVQICHEWNTARHAADHEARPQVRPFTRVELQKFFDFADEQVGRADRLGRKGSVAAFRDATLFKVIYAYGLRRTEAAMLDIGDFTRNPKAPEFGRLGACNVRYGKAMRGSPPRRRTVLTVMGWSVEVLEEYLEHVRPAYTPGAQPALWPTERGGRIRAAYIDTRFAQYRDELGLPAELHPHCLRHSYVTHLIEDGFDPFFVQQQVGHRWGSTTALYTGVSGDFKNRMLRRALDAALPADSPTGTPTDHAHDGRQEDQ
ncbi:tyrosine-type recombinase/integrase [Pseudonocardia sp. WMMC193]|uniref:tyrosine-type recombinase/integrase n=1 Tax=Pseudonocardia sp. WMMC193 TaxID=2911965 RepID=UPI001F023A6D|nr:tyrosine-type recombinase/integrase [Pseudonocardia sp. WMMC193]MCF7552662.1 tyrosine-type recombinase/integrase [Pseudonocardia sp. WMMC193]